MSPENEISPLEIYRRMALVRAFEEERLALWRAGRIAGELFLALGQEATAVGLTAALAPGDTLFPSRRGLALRLAAGLSPEAALRPAGGATPGLATPAGHLPIAVGTALAGRLAGRKTVCLAEFGEGASCDGLYHETVRIAMCWQAPIVFAMINNGYAAGSPSAPAAAEGAIAAASALGLPVARVDGQDAIQVLAAVRALLEGARSRPGPALIECRTYCIAPRLLSGAVVETRPASEVDFWRNRDPLRRLQVSLLQSGMAHDQTLALIADTTRSEVQRAVRRVFGTAPPAGSRALAPLHGSPGGDRA